MILRVILRSLLLLSLASLVLHSYSAETPKPGSPDRKAILDALRVPVQKEIGFPVVFRISHLKIKDNWAFLKGQPRTKDDKPIDYSKTSLDEEARTADELLVAVLKKTDGRWRVVEHAIFTTDVWWHGIHERLGAPAEIFDYSDSPD